MYSWSRDKVGIYIIRSALPHANSMFLSSIEPELLPIEVLHVLQHV